MTFLQEHKHGIIGAAIFAAVILLLLFLLGFTTPLPLPEERGILIDFGGGGSLNAGASSSTASTNQNISIPSPSNSGHITQSIEEAPSLPSNVNPNVVTPKPNNVVTDNTANTTEQNNPTNRLNENLTGLNLGGTLNGSGSGLSGTGSGTGNPGLGNGTNGMGSGPGGIGGSLTGRRQVKKVEPERKENMFGKVELRITVDEKGNIVDIDVISTNCNECVTLAMDAVKQWKYEPKPKSGLQVGNVIVEFKQN